jgi:hypothetical protein
MIQFHKEKHNMQKNEVTTFNKLTNSPNKKRRKESLSSFSSDSDDLTTSILSKNHPHYMEKPFKLKNILEFENSYKALKLKPSYKIYL